MKILKIKLSVNRYNASYAHWAGNGTGTLPCDEPILDDIKIYQNTRADKYPTPWFVRASHLQGEAIMLCNTTFYDMKVNVNGVIHDVPGMESIVVPLNVITSEAFIDLCHQHAVYDLKDIRKVSINLSRLTWCTGINAYMEAVN